MRKQKTIYKDASFTVEAALLYPIIILLMVFCIQKTIDLYESVRLEAEHIYAEKSSDTMTVFMEKVQFNQIKTELEK